MNPAHLVIVSLITLIYWLMGYWTGKDTKCDFWPNFPSLLMMIAATFYLCFGIFVLVKEAL
jgi:hypothetical protein